MALANVCALMVAMGTAPPPDSDLVCIPGLGIRDASEECVIAHYERDERADMSAWWTCKSDYTYGEGKLAIDTREEWKEWVNDWLGIEPPSQPRPGRPPLQGVPIYSGTWSPPATFVPNSWNVVSGSIARTTGGSHTPESVMPDEPLITPLPAAGWMLITALAGALVLARSR